jgi:hypothetical protein
LLFVLPAPVKIAEPRATREESARGARPRPWRPPPRPVRRSTTSARGQQSPLEPPLSSCTSSAELFNSNAQILPLSAPINDARPRRSPRGRQRPSSDVARTSREKQTADCHNKDFGSSGSGLIGSIGAPRRPVGPGGASRPSGAAAGPPRRLWRGRSAAGPERWVEGGTKRYPAGSRLHGPK